MVTVTYREQLQKQINTLPDDIVQQIADFTSFVIARRKITSVHDEHNNNNVDGQNLAQNQLLHDENDFDEKEWLYAAAINPAFESLRESQEDIYTITDGQPFHDEI